MGRHPLLSRRESGFKMMEFQPELAQMTAFLKNSRVIDLGRVLEDGMPCSPSHPGFKMALIRRHGDRVNAHGMSGSNELLVLGGHVGTHVDALCHVALAGKMFGGHDAYEASHGGRYTVHGAETIEPFLCRGVLADIPKLLGLGRLAPGFGITAEHVKRALGDLDVQPGEVVLIRSGWPQLYSDPAAYLGVESGVPGITSDAATYLADLGVRAVGCDTTAMDQLAAGVGHSSLPAHIVLLVQRGVHIIEVGDYEELAQSGAREFMFVAVPLKLKGATGSPIRPLAIVTLADDKW